MCSLLALERKRLREEDDCKPPAELLLMVSSIIVLVTERVSAVWVDRLSSGRVSSNFSPKLVSLKIASIRKLVYKLFKLHYIFNT